MVWRVNPTAESLLANFALNCLLLRMNKATRFKLFVMMVLEIFIWGAWLPLIYQYLTNNPNLKFTDGEVSWIMNTFPIAAIVGMFFSNQFADRNFAAEKFLAFSHLVGGCAILALSFVHNFWLFFVLMLVHCLLYVPTLSICNSIAFASMKDPQKEFGSVRMGGTIGWVLAAWPFSFILVDWAKVKAANPQGIVAWLGTVFGSGLQGGALQDGARWIFVVAGIASLLLAAFSLTLPHTPPRKVATGSEKLAWMQAGRLLSHPFVLVLWIVTFVDATVQNSYFVYASTFLGSKEVGIPGNWVMPVMSLGQIAEILTMAILGLVLKRLGWRTTMILGILGHTARFAVFAFLPQFQGLVIAVNLLHGICYAFFFATVYIFAEEFFPKDVRASAQGLFNVMILGLGPLLAYSAGPWLMNHVFTVNNVTDFHGLFIVPTAIATAAAIILALFFRPPASGQSMAAAGARKAAPVEK